MANTEKLSPAAGAEFKDQLNFFMSEGYKDHSDIVRTIKEEVLEFVHQYGPWMKERAVEFHISAGKVMRQYYGRGTPNTVPICLVDDLPAIKDIFAKDGFTLEWAYDKGALYGRMLFRWTA